MARTMLVLAAAAVAVAAVLLLLPGPQEDTTTENPAEDPDAKTIAVHEEDAASRTEPALPEEPAADAPEAAPPDPAEDDESAHRAEVDRWIEQLSASSNNTVFQATLELARLGDPRAVEPLVEALEGHLDFYVRLGAATALGKLEAFDAVPSLIVALDDKDQLVRTGAAEALKTITGHEIEYKPGASAEEREAAMDAWREWWTQNETRVRNR